MRPEIINSWPPNIAAIRKALPVTINNIFAYGGKIYSPAGTRLPPELIAHEMVHFRQQGDDSEGWWERFLRDPKFRLDQELPAHQAEYRAILARNPPRKVRRYALKSLAKRLSAPMYGGIISPKRAMVLIKGEQHDRGKQSRRAGST